MKQLNWLEMAKSSMRRQIGQMQQQQTCSLANGTDVRSNQSRMPAKPATGRPMVILNTFRSSRLHVYEICLFVCL